MTEKISEIWFQNISGTETTSSQVNNTSKTCYRHNACIETELAKLLIMLLICNEFNNKNLHRKLTSGAHSTQQFRSTVIWICRVFPSLNLNGENCCSTNGMPFYVCEFVSIDLLFRFAKEIISEMVEQKEECTETECSRFHFGSTVICPLFGVFFFAFAKRTKWYSRDGSCRSQQNIKNSFPRLIHFKLKSGRSSLSSFKQSSCSEEYPVYR